MVDANACRNVIFGAAVLMLPLAGRTVTAGGLALHVAPLGDDAAAGTVSAPLATPQGAVARLRRLRAAGEGKDAVSIVFAAGRYALSAPWTLSAGDGGTEAAPVVWRAASPGAVVFTGAASLGQWMRVTDPAVLAKLPEIARGEVYETHVPGVDSLGDFSGGRLTATTPDNDPVQLFEASERLSWARWPDEGYTQVQDVLGEITRNHDSAFSKSGVIRYASPRLANWARESDLWANGLWVYAWSDRRVRVRTADAAAGTMAFDGIGKDPFGIKKGGEFYVFNALCELDRPGEWVLDRAARRLFLWPKRADDLTNGLVTVTRLPRLLEARGLAHTTFSGFAFEGARADFAVFEDCRDVSVQGCAARHGGGCAFRATRGARVRFMGCDVLDVGRGGMALEGGDLKTLAPGGHVVENCHIAHYAVVSPNYNPGVSLRGVGNAVTNSLIHHAPHQAVAFDGNEHLIARNVIHDTCSYNDDAGAIYCCGQKMGWNARGTVIAENVIWFTGKRVAPRNTHAVYLDDWSSGITVRDNLIVRCNNGVSLGGGNFVYVTNNVFVSALPSVQVGGRGRGTFGERYCLDGFKSSFFSRLTSARKDPAWRARYPETARLYDVEDGVRAHDPLYNVIAHNVCVMSGEPNLSRYGVDNVVTDNVTCAEAGFTDWKGMDWSLRADSPVRKALGHDSCWAQAGLYASPHRASPPVKFGADVTRFETVPRPAYPPAVPRIDVSVTPVQLPTNLTADKIHMRDPFVVPDPESGTYCLVSSCFAEKGEKAGDGFGFLGTGVRIYESRDLVNWSAPQQVLTIPDWVDCKAFWAPEIHRYRDKWYVFGTVNYGKTDGRGTWTFVSDRLRGPYRPTGRRSVTPPEWKSLDGTLWVEDGRPYMVFCHEWTQVGNGEICSVQLTDDLSAPVGRPQTLLKATDYTADPKGVGHRDHVTDGPFLYRSTKSGKLFMTWSNISADDRYLVIASESASGRLAGPWNRHRIVFERNGGHGMIFRRFDGTLEFALHSPNGPPNERPRFFAMTDDGNVLTLRH